MRTKQEIAALDAESAAVLETIKRSLSKAEGGCSHAGEIPPDYIMKEGDMLVALPAPLRLPCCHEPA